MVRCSLFRSALAGAIAMIVAQLWAAGLCAAVEDPATAAASAKADAKYIADPEMESLIEKATDADSAVARLAFDQLFAQRAAAERAVLHRLQKEPLQSKVRFAELLSKLDKGRVGYRVTLELQPDGAGTLTLWSDRTVLAECGRLFDKLMGKRERVYNDDDLRQNMYSKVELIKYMDDGMRHLEARVDEQNRAIVTMGLLSFKSFESLAKFADGFDRGSFYMLNGATFFDSEPGVRSYRFHKAKELNKDLYANNLLLFYPVRWEFVLDCKAKMLRNNASRTEGGKLIWSFDIAQMLRGEAQIEAVFDVAGQPARPAPKDDSAIALPSTVSQQPVAILAKKLIRARACKHSGAWQELIEHNQLVDLDGRNSIGRDGPLQFKWAQTFGQDLQLNPDSLVKDRVGMRIPDPGEYRFELVVTCNGVQSKPEELVVYVEPEDGVASADTTKPTPAAPSTPPTPKNDTDTALNGMHPEPAKPKIPPDTAKTEAPPVPEHAQKPEPTQVASASKNDPNKTTDSILPKTAIGKPDPARAKELHEKARTLLKAFNYKDAKPILAEAAAAAPQDWEIIQDYAIALLETGDIPQAMLRFEDVAGNSVNAEAMMYVGHCSARAGSQDDAREWYGRAIAIAKDKVEWEILWQYGNMQLQQNDYQMALTALKDSERQANKANVNDVRLHRDFAIALHNLKQDPEALKHLKAVQELGYTPDPQLVADVTKGAGASLGDAPHVNKVVSADPPAIKPASAPAPAKVDPPKVEPKPEPAPAKVDPPKPEPTPAKVKDPEPAPPPKVAVTDPPKPVTPPAPPVKVMPPVPERTKADKRADVRPAYPKKPLPPIPKDFDACMTAGKQALHDAQGHIELKTDEDRIKTAQAFDLAEAMYRGAWALRPGDETVVAAFRELAEYNGAIALVKSPLLKCKARGIVVLDAESSVGPKDKPLYCVWEQTDGEDLSLRAEDLAKKQVSLKIRKPGRYKFDLAVSDGVRGGNPVSVTIEVEE